MEFIIIFSVMSLIGFILFNSKSTKENFNVENNLGEAVFTHNCYFTTHLESGKRTDPIIYRIYYNQENNKYTLKGYGNDWEAHSNYKQVFKCYRGVVDGLYEIKAGQIITKKQAI